MKKYWVLIIITVLILTYILCVYSNKLNNKSAMEQSVFIEKTNKMAIDLSYRYLLDLKNNDYKDIRAMEIYNVNDPADRYKAIKSINVATLSDFLQIENYSDKEIKERLKIVEIKDKWAKLTEIANLSMCHFPGYVKLEDSIDVDYENYRTVLFENGNRSMIIMSYYYKGKMSFMPLYYLSEDFAYKRFNDITFEYDIRMDFVKERWYSLVDEKNNEHLLSDPLITIYFPDLISFKFPRYFIVKNNKTGRKIKIEIE